MRTFLAFLMLIVCGDMAYGAPRRVLPAAISQSANNNQNTTDSAPPLSHGNNVVKSRAASAPAPAVKSRTAVRSSVSPSPRNSIAPVAPRAAVASRAAVRSRAATTNTTAPAALQSLVDAQTANDECLDSYTKCMDNYCNVLDADLGRCSCSGDITQFARVSDALATANTELQDVMKKISYLGLSADEITSMYTQTAAEGVMGTVTDTSKIKSDLNAITNMLVDVKTPSSSTTASGDGIPGLLNIDLTANNFDINSVLGTIGGTNSSPLLNQRGEQLYKSAAARCKSSVLKNCIGADENVVVSRYKTEINRACIAYGNTLQTKNDDARRMIDNAGRVLQMARLKVQSDKDAYDLKACVAALDTCMRDDFVCGDDYGHCLDASGRYFVNGELVSGAAESKIMTDIWGAATPSSDGAFIAQHATNTNIASLIQRVGNPITRDGLCSNVLNKCQKQWRDGKSNRYDSMNNVVLAWLGDVIPKIVVRQRTLINDFRTDCVSTVNACMTKQGMPSNIKPRGTQPIIGDFLVAQVGACRTTIDACAGVMGMTDKQILAQYIDKNICSGYSIKYDMCDGDSLCDATLNTCMTNGLGESSPTETQFIIGDFLASQVASCDTIISTCANADGIAKEDLLAQYIKKNVCSGYNATYDMCDYSDDIFRIVTTNMAAGTVFSFKMSAKGNFTVNWGDGGIDNIVRTDTAEATYSHTYTTAGVRTIMFLGSATEYSTDVTIPTNGEATATAVISFKDNSNINRVMGSLGTLFPTIGNGVDNGTQPRFYRTFYNCSKMSSIPGNLFSGISGATELMFQDTFNRCRQLSEIPRRLFSGISGNAANLFFQTFFLCVSITDIPGGLFSGIKGGAPSMFQATFAQCYELQTIPEGLFSGVDSAAENMFALTFAVADTGLHTNKITRIPAGLFWNVKGAAKGMFNGTFWGCQNLTTISNHLFAQVKGAAESMFSGTFRECTKLATIPENLFQNVTGSAENMFGNTFMRCRSLKAIPDDLFKGVSELKHLIFYGTFEECTSLTGPSTKIGGLYLYQKWPNATADQVRGCYTGATKLSDYNEIPNVWKQSR